MSNIQSIAWLCACPTPFLEAQVNVLKKYIPEVDLVFFENLSLHPERLAHWQVSNELAISVHLFLKKLNTYQFVISGLPVSNLGYIKIHRYIQKNSRLILHNEIPCRNSSRLKSIVKKYIYSRILRLIDPLAIFAIGDCASEYYGSIAPKHCFVTPLPYFIEHIKDSQLLLSGCSNASTKNSNLNSFKFIFSGQLIKRNNLFTLVEAFHYLNNTIRVDLDLSLEIYGSGPLEYKLHRYIKDLCLDSAVTINSIPPSLWTDRLLPLYSSDCLISVPTYSGWGLTIPEALACGKPVIATTSALAAQNYMVNGINGILITKYCSIRLAAAMMEVITNYSNYTFPGNIHSDDEYAFTLISLLNIASLGKL